MIRISLDWQFETVQAQRPTSGLDTLYKYVRTEHISSVVDKGIFKIGNLYDFRNMEFYGPEVGDASEGHKTIFSYDNKEDWNNENSGKFLKTFGVIKERKIKTTYS